MFCELFSLQPFATGYTTPPSASEKNPTTAPCSGILQWHQHAKSKATHHFNCSTLKQHPAAAPPASSRAGHSNSCTLLRAAAPFTGTLAARVGYSTYPPCSTLKHHPLHQQASSTAPSSSTFHPHPLTSMPAPKQGLQHTPLCQQHLQSSPSGSTCSSTLSATSIAPNCTHHSDSKQHTAPAPCSGIPTAPRCPLQSAHTTLTAARTASTACQLQSAPRMV